MPFTSLSKGLTDKTVLAVEDDEGIGRLYQEILSDLVGCQVECTPDPEEALALLTQRQFDLVILDMRLPKISGAAFMRLSQYLMDSRMPPVIVATAHQDWSPDMPDGFKPIAILSKPFDMYTLVSLVRASLERETAW